MLAGTILHLLGVVVWVGGTFLIHRSVYPSVVSNSEISHGIEIYLGVLERFFPWMWIAMIVTMGSGFWIIISYYGGFELLAYYIHIMSGLAFTMLAIVVVSYLMPYRGLKAAVKTKDWAKGKRQMLLIHRLMGGNLLLGIITILVAMAGPEIQSAVGYL